MKVAIYVADQNQHRDRSLGITGYTDGLIRALDDLKAVDLQVLSSRSSYSPAGREVQTQRLPFATDRAVGRLAADHLHPLFFQTDADLWHYPKGYLPLLNKPRTPVVGTVHDVILQYQADHYPAARSRLAYSYWITMLKRSIARFDYILTISKFSETAIHEFCARYALRCPPVRVTYEGFGVERLPTGEKENTVVHLASTELHKRTSTILDFWKQLRSSQRDLPQLKLIGTLSARDRAAAEALSGVEIVGRLPRPALEAEIARARALLLPSEIEGFGLPALESYALGTGVLYVKGTAVEEVLGEGSPGGFVLDDVDSFRAALEDVLGLPAAAVREKAAHLRTRFSWAECGRRTAEVYRECLEAD